MVVTLKDKHKRGACYLLRKDGKIKGAIKRAQISSIIRRRKPITLAAISGKATTK